MQEISKEAQPFNDSKYLQLIKSHEISQFWIFLNKLLIFIDPICLRLKKLPIKLN